MAKKSSAVSESRVQLVCAMQVAERTSFSKIAMSPKKSPLLKRATSRRELLDSFINAAMTPSATMKSSLPYVPS